MKKPCTQCEKSHVEVIDNKPYLYCDVSSDECIQKEAVAAYGEYLKRRRKYEQGEQITSFEELIEQDLIMVHDKVYSKGWFMGWQFKLVCNYLKQGICYKAKNKQYKGVD